jgi:hypothetical protein
MSIWNQIKNLFARSEQTMNEANTAAASPIGGGSLNQEALVDLMRRLEKTMENAYSCEEVFALLDEYVELVTDDEEAKRLMPLVENHLDICPDCKDEFEVLLHILQTADPAE